jgi:hypothetical protein
MTSKKGWDETPENGNRPSIASIWQQSGFDLTNGSSMRLVPAA